jgi:hypothetical protein
VVEAGEVSCGIEPYRKTGGETTERFDRSAEDDDTCLSNLVVSLSASATARRGRTHARDDKAFRLEADEGLVDGADREVAPCGAPDRFLYRDAISVAAESQRGEEDDLFELTEQLGSI